MRHIRGLTTTIDALQRTFLPSKHLQPSIPPLFRARLPDFQPQSCRNAHYVPLGHAQPNVNTKLTTSRDPLRDEAINAFEIHIVSPTGNLLPPTSLEAALQQLDRENDMLIQVAETVHPSQAHLLPPAFPSQHDTRRRVPVCKVVNKAVHRKAEKEKSKAKKDAAATTKTIEVSWGIDGHDLEHRMKRMENFLMKGRRVEVLFGRKRKGWRKKQGVEEDEAREVVRKVKSAMERCEGAKEWRQSEGAVGAQMVLHFQGKQRTESETEE
ncbi:MAG: hypothetical protein LQ351_003347 [Letrouitia transgressa]|nr:MAG: hypothetical protein LQ351_003347 [Letrouitia transgressa]